MAIEIRPSDVAGSGVFASASVQAGGLILARDRPTFAALDTQRLPEACSTCFTWNPDGADQLASLSANVTMKVCTGCKTLRYCSKQCQAKSWPQHKKECKFLGALARDGNGLPNAARLVLQMLTSYVNTSKTPLPDLHSHLPEIAAVGGPRHETLQFLSNGLREFTGKVADVEFFQRCFALVYTNALTINTATFDPIGVCVDEVVAKVNHSCYPNAFVVFDGPKMSIRALKPISKDEEVFISYIDCTNPFSRRQDELKEQYYFTCKCIQCVRGATLAADAFKEKRPSGELLEVEIAAFSNLEEGKKETEPQTALQKLDEGLQACLKTNVWPECRQPIPSLRHEAFVSLLSAEQWVRAFKQGLKIYFDVLPKIYPEPFHPLRVTQKWTLAKLALFLADAREPNVKSQLDTAGLDFGIVILGLLTEVYDNVRLSHGDKHSFAHEVQAKYQEVIVDISRADDQRLKDVRDGVPTQWTILRKFSSSEDVNSVAL